MLHRLATADVLATIVQPMSFVFAILLGFGALSAPYAIAVLIRQYTDLHFALAGAIAIAASAFALYAAYVAARSGRARRVLYLPVFGLEILSFWGIAILFGI